MKCVRENRKNASILLYKINNIMVCILYYVLLLLLYIFIKRIYYTYGITEINTVKAFGTQAFLMA